VNDGDTLLKLPNREQVLSQLRAYYGRNLRASYGNKMSQDHEGYNTTLIICGTAALRQLDASELGERFLDCVIMENIDEDLEDEILQRVALRAARNTGVTANGSAATRYDPDLAHAMRLTGGYVEYLRRRGPDLVGAVATPGEALRRCVRYGKFVSYMRARPSTHQDETAEREFAARLVSQVVRLAKCLAAVLGRRSLDDEVMRRVRLVALDTARGRTLRLVRHLYRAGEVGLERRELEAGTGETPVKLQELLQFLHHIRVARRYRPTGQDGKVSYKYRWRLAPRLRALYAQVAAGGKAVDGQSGEERAASG
jgi:hypothetical protein